MIPLRFLCRLLIPPLEGAKASMTARHGRLSCVKLTHILTPRHRE
jgi:hypothetical protein